MLIHNTTGATHREESTLSYLGNIDYYKRHIILEVPTTITDEIQMTIVNISSNSNNSVVNIYRSGERSQQTNIYHASGKILGLGQYIGPDDSPESIITRLDRNAMVAINDISYGNHDYDLSKKSSLHITSSYGNTNRDSDGYTMVPNVRFYNPEHHVVEQDKQQREFIDGRSFLDASNVIAIEYVPLHELIDDHTYILIHREGIYDRIGDSNVLNLMKNNLASIVIGPITVMMTYLLFNKIQFLFDSELGFAHFRWETEHGLPSDEYLNKFKELALNQFKDSMDDARDMVGYPFRIFVHNTLGTIQMRIKEFDIHGNLISENNLSYDVGKFRNDQHFLTKFNVNMDTHLDEVIDEFHDGVPEEELM